jgi:hypothetical protein
MLQKSEAAKGSNKRFWVGSGANSNGGTDGSRSLDLDVQRQPISARRA